MKYISILLIFLFGCWGCGSTQSESDSRTPAMLTHLTTEGQSFSASIEAQWEFVFPSKSITSEEAKKVISEFQTEFEQRDEAIALNLKMIESDGFISRVWFLGDKLIAAEWVDEEIGVNGSKTVYLDQNGKVKVVFQDAHGSSWFNQYYYYVNTDGRVYSYSYGAEIQYDEEGIGHYDGEDLPLSSRLKEDEEVEGINPESDLLKAKALFSQAKELSDDRSGVYNYEGQIQWKTDFIMNLDTDNKGRISGKYRIGKTDILLTGTLDEERFHLQEQNDNAGEWIGRWVELDKVWGKYRSSQTKDWQYFEMKPRDGYRFSN